MIEALNLLKQEPASYSHLMHAAFTGDPSHLLPPSYIYIYVYIYTHTKGGFVMVEMALAFHENKPALQEYLRNVS